MNTSRNSQAGFNLFELMVVMAIIAALVVMVAPALSTSLKGSQLTQASDALINNLAFARQAAIAGNCSVEVRFYQYKDAIDGTGNGKHRAFQLFKIMQDGSAVALAKVQTLPQSIIIDSNTSLSTLLTLVQPAPTVPLPGVGVSYTYAAFRFRPDGSTNLVSGNPYWCLTLHNATEGDNRSAPPSNYSTVQVDPFSGYVTTYRP